MSRSILGAGLLLVLLVVADITVLGAEAGKKHFLIRIQPVRATFNDDATPEEQKVMGKHFAYLQKLLKEGKLVMAGPAETGEFGLILVEVADIDEAQKIMRGDPSVKANIMEGDVYLFNLALLRGRD
ncbi:MAG: hypothetical protein GY953_26555 [bacterium]|nr:hypothetical protein [bacterium]